MAGLVCVSDNQGMINIMSDIGKKEENLYIVGILS